ncbi:metallophosphoesterase, partial [Glaesserella parasuis]|nr:metallophosphoesterase [Glaesserella parasuis]
MEYRYYIITTVSVIALQFLLFCFSKTATWLGDLSNRSRKIVTFSIYIVANLLIILHVTRILPNFRLIALILTLLLFIFFISFCFWGIYTVGKQIFSPNSLNRWLKISYIPVLFGLIGLTIYNAYSTKVVHYQVTLDKPI